MVLSERKSRINNFIRMRREFVTLFYVAAVFVLPPLFVHSQTGVQKDQEFVTESGLKYKIVQKGQGAKAEKGKEIGLHGIGYFEDGKVFWNSREDRSLFYFVLGEGRVIKGCDEGVALMRVGDRFLFTMKPELAYGEKGRGELIPPNSTLIFDYEVLSVEDPKMPISDVLDKTIKEKGIAEAVNLYGQLKKSESAKYNFREDQLNRLGSRLLKEAKVKEAISIFELNVSAYPDSSNAYYSLAEALLKDEQKERALVNYQKALQLNPKNTNAAEMIKKLQKEDGTEKRLET